MSKKAKKLEPSVQIPPQEFSRYNRESGKKTLVLVGILITIIVLFTTASLFLMNTQ